MKHKILLFDSNSLDYKKVHWAKFYTTIASFAAIFVFIGYVISPGEVLKTKHVEYEKTPLIIKQDLTFSEAKLWELLNDMHVRFPHIVLAQARIESGHYKSKIFRTNNNLFGMKVSKNRCTVHKGQQLNHAAYDSWQESAIDYAFFQTSYLRDIKKEQHYYEYLANHYAEAGDSYATAVRSEANKIKKEFGKLNMLNE